MKRKLITLWRLGPHNLVWVIGYRLALKVGLITKNMKIGSAIKGPFFISVNPVVDNSLESLDLKIFGWCEYSKLTPPVWHESIISGELVNVQSLHWSKISDFDLNIGDIKTVWELSRFDWLFYFIIEFLKTGDKKHLSRLNLWLENWSKNNPCNQGVNWKCGQEVSIRVMHLCLTSFLLQQHKKLSHSGVQMLEQHLARISPTVLYAMGQDNNHGTSEAVALYIGGLLLENNTTNNTRARKWKNQGRFWIENRVNRLIANDGSFSQHSVNYHRVMLDSVCLAEFFRMQFCDLDFSQQTITKIRLAIDWLNIFTDSSNGEAPNLGANDGAKLIPLSSSDYCDYRPTVQLASALFYRKRCYHEDGAFNQPLKLLQLKVEEALPAKILCKKFNEGGYVYIAKSAARLFMRYPVFNFRPSQCDVFHVDFWLKGNNIFSDAGSYSYNAEKFWLNYFSSTTAHNTVQFDNSEQMPRLSRFLYGDWLNVKECTDIYAHGDNLCFKAGYQDVNKIEHYREINLSDIELTVIDEVSGFNNNAVVRWRLAPGNYDIQGDMIIADDFELAVTADVEIKRFELVEGWVSQYYMKKKSLPVLEIEVFESAKVVTKVMWR
ncbi:MAG: heparinase [Gammaproteobacteria bacterium]|nr:heparinase [Gammaproteobacteria bacterium]